MQSDRENVKRDDGEESRPALYSAASTEQKPHGIASWAFQLDSCHVTTYIHWPIVDRFPVAEPLASEEVGEHAE